MTTNPENFSAGPGAAPEPWNLVSSGTIAYDGAVLIPSSATGGSKGAGSLNVGALFIQGINLATTLTSYLPLAGGTLTGPLNVGALANLVVPGGTSGFVLSTNGSGSLSWIAVGGLADAPSNGNFYGRLGGAWVIPTHTAISDWNTAISVFLNLAGGTLTGPLTLAANPTVALGAATKQYVDNGEWVGFTNKFRNANFDVWQRGTTVPISANTATYTADGWIVTLNGSAGSAILQWDGPTSTYGMRVQASTTATITSIAQRIESSISSSLGGNQVTFQALIFNNTSATITPGFIISHPTGTPDNWGASISDIASNFQACPVGVVTRVAYTYSLPQASALMGIQISFNINSSLVTGSYVEITQCDIRATPGVASGINNSPPPVELRPISISLNECQRYYETSYPNLIAPGTAGVTQGSSFILSGLPSATYSSGLWVSFKVEKRINPTVINTFSPATGVISDMRNAASSVDVPAGILQQNTYGFLVFPSGSFTANTVVNINVAFAASAEL